jgi:hypothetical protein
MRTTIAWWNLNAMSGHCLKNILTTLQWSSCQTCITNHAVDMPCQREIIYIALNLLRVK